MRDWNAVAAHFRRGGPMRDRRAPRGGARNYHRELLAEYKESEMDIEMKPCINCGEPTEMECVQCDAPICDSMDCMVLNKAATIEGDPTCSNWTECVARYEKNVSRHLWASNYHPMYDPPPSWMTPRQRLEHRAEWRERMIAEGVAPN